jgi:hypothetical protein
MSSPQIEFHYATVCDDVRREDNGKLILIGVYGSDISFKQLPAEVSLNLVIPTTASDALEMPLEVRVQYDGKEVAKGAGTIRTRESGHATFVIPNIEIQIPDHPSTLEFAVRPGDGKWQTVRSLPVLLYED